MLGIRNWFVQLAMHTVVAIGGFALLAPLARAQVNTNTIRVAVPQAKDAATERYIEAFRKQVGQADFKIEEVPVGAGTSYAQILASLKEGGSSIDLALVPAAVIPDVQSDPAFTYTSLISQPGLIDNASQNFAVQNSVVGELVATELSDFGLTLVGFWNRPPQALFMKTPLTGAYDLKGVKVRITDDTSGAVLTSLGASAQRLPFAEVTMALVAGSVDAIEASSQGLSNVSDIYRAIPNGRVLNNYSQNQGFLLANSTKWVGYSQRLRSAVQAAAGEGSKASQTLIIDQESTLPKMAAEFGVSYVSVNSEAWRPISKTASEAWLQNISEGGRSDAYQQLLRVKQEIDTRRDRRGSLDQKIRPTVLFATNRNDESSGDLATRFGVLKDATNQLSCGEIEFDTSPQREFGQVFGGRLGLKGSTIWHRATGCADMLAASGTNTGLVVYFHGYANTFADAARRAIGFSQDFGLSQPVLVWSWPSAGSFGMYIFDLNSVQFSEEYIRQMVDAMERKGQLSNITIVAHSMGSRMAGIFLKQVRARNRDVKNLILIAADYPPSIFGQLIASEGSVAALKTLYANENDSALIISRKMNGENPVGLGGKYLKLVQGIETVDVSDVAGQGWVNHAHGFEVKPVADDISDLLKRRVGADIRQLPTASVNGTKYWTIRGSPH
ncbi:TRAP transporter substrate-binding protein DctP [Rhizobium sp. 18065]|uniref:TRAP transporter substrate-binding protein DctP n=1 Tax=Rhizobium sp. 18065 TaxID=2681411 RepID=UPI00135A07E1|nr:TRAP transporter substrate-binding protein DctP [Rhizobium sp. 18065]